MKKMPHENIEENEVVENKEGCLTESEFARMVLDEINNKTLNIIGDFNEDLVKYVRSFANNIWFYESDELRNIQINISSRGGQLNALFSILDILDELKEIWDCNFIGSVNGYAYSCGALLFMYCDRRHMGNHSELMFHRLIYGINAPLSDHEMELKRSRKIQKELDRIIIEKSNITNKQLNNWYNKEGDKFIDRKEAMKLGILTDENGNVKVDN